MNELERNIENELARLTEVRLSPVARARIAEKLQTHSALSAAPIPSPFSISTIFMNQKLYLVPALALIAIVIVGGSTSAAAASALPNDFLYPIKTDVNERIKTALTFDEADKATLHAELAHERLYEAETLAAEGKLSTSTAEKLAANLKQHRERAEALSDELAHSGDLETAAQVHAMITGTFRTYEDVLDGLDKKVEGNNSNALLSDIRHYLENHHATATSTPIVLSDTTKQSVADTVAYADTIVNKANTTLAGAGNLPANLIDKIKKLVDDAMSAETEAKTALTNNDYQSAYDKATQAIQTATEALTLVASSGNIGKHHKGDDKNLESLMEDEVQNKTGNATSTLELHQDSNRTP